MVEFNIEILNKLNQKNDNSVTLYQLSGESTTEEKEEKVGIVNPCSIDSRGSSTSFFLRGEQSVTIRVMPGTGREGLDSIKVEPPAERLINVEMDFGNDSWVFRISPITAKDFLAGDDPPKTTVEVCDNE